VINYYELCACAGTIGHSELHELLNYAKEDNLVELHRHSHRVPFGFQVKLTIAGHRYVDQLHRSAPTSTQGFVAMWFNPQMDAVYDNGFKLAIEDAGYKPVRIDRKEHNNKIDDEIIAEIRRSKFLIADFTSELVEKFKSDGSSYLDTHARGGVYFEAGFAKGLGREVIWTVRRDVLEAQVLHFDTRQFAHIDWSSPEELRSKLCKRILATFGEGPLKRIG
jgi:hypothetical protein